MQEYFKLRLFFKENSTTFSLSELAFSWEVSTKQARRRLQKFQEENLLTFTPGLGRGNLSKISFNSSFQQEYSEAVAFALNQENFKELSTLLDLPVPAEWLQPFYQEIQKHFGVTTDNEEFTVMRQFMIRPLTTLDPLKTSIFREVNILYQLGDCLVKINDGKLLPGLAHHWQFNSENLSWTFYLRKGVLFHHGKILTSEDISYTFKRILDSFRPWQLEHLVKIVAVGQYRVTFYFNQEEPLFPAYLISSLFIILPSDRPFSPENWSGTGAFRLKENNQQQSILQAFDQYYDKRPLLDEVQLIVMDTDEKKNRQELLKRGYKLVQQETSGVEFLVTNMKKNSVLQKQKVRQALYEIADLANYPHRHGELASHYFSSDENKEEIPQKSLITAQRCLKEANYQGEEVILGYVEYAQKAQEFAQWLQKRAKKVGLHLKIVGFSFTNEFYNDFIEKNVDVVSLGDIPVAGSLFPYLEFIASPTLLIQRLLDEPAQKYLAEMIESYKLAPITERGAEDLQIDQWLTGTYQLIYTIHPQKEHFIHPVLAGLNALALENYDYRLAWTGDGNDF